MLKLSFASLPGSPTHVRATLRNESPERVRFLYWNTPFDPLCPRGLELDGGPLPSVPYRGARAKYAFDPATSLVALAPGEAIERDIDVAINYRLPAAAPYTVAFAGRLRGLVGDALVATACDLTTLEMETSADECSLVPASNDHLFPEAFATPTADVADITACQEPPICWNSYYEHPLKCVLRRARYGHARVEGGSEALKTVVRRAVDRLFDHIAPYGPYRFEVKDSAEYRRWFGPYTEARAEQVRLAVRGIRGQSVCKTFVIHILPSCVNPDVIAVFRKPDSENRYGAMGLCRPFFREGETGHDSQAGTLAHELSHGYADTEDHEYGVTCCLRLAARYPDLAVRNADSIQYYLEDVLLSLAVAEGEDAAAHAAS